MEFGETCLTGFREIYPDHLIYRYDPGDDLKAGLLNFRNNQVDSAAIVAFEPDFLNWFKLCKDQNYPTRMGFMQIMLSETVASTLGKNEISRSTIMSYGSIPADFAERLKSVSKLPGDEFNLQAAALSHNAVSALVNALSSCKSEDLKCIDLNLRKSQTLMLDFQGWGTGHDASYPVRIDNP